MSHIHVTGSFKSAMVKQLVGLGFDRTLAEHQVAQQIEGEKLDAAPDPARPTAAIAFPLELTLPWSALISDNAKYAPAGRGTPPRPVIILTEPYRAAKEKIKTIVRPRLIGCAPVVDPAPPRGSRLGAG
jgi:hypothetical protein